MRGQGSVFEGLLALFQSRSDTAVKSGQTDLGEKNGENRKKKVKFFWMRKSKKTKKKVKECMMIVQIGECVQTLDIV